MIKMEARTAQLNTDVENQHDSTSQQEMSISQNEKNKNEEDDLRRRLNFFYSNPCQRWKMRDRSRYDRIPSKLIVQILKLVIVTIQAVLLGIERSNIAIHIEQSTTAMKSIFLQDYVPPDTHVPVTLEHPDMAIYTTSKLLKMINHAVDQFQDVKSMAFGSFYYSYYDNGTVVPLNMEFKFYNARQFFPQNLTLFLDPTVKTASIDVAVDPKTSVNKLTKVSSGTDSVNTSHYDIELQLSARNLSHHLDRLLEVNLNFMLKNVLLGSLFGKPEIHCLKYYVNIMFDNNKRSGKVAIMLNSKVSKLHCHQGNYPKNWLHDFRIILLATIIIPLNFASIVFCSGAIKNSLKLMLVTKTYFKKHLGLDLSRREMFSFIKLWDTLIIANDALTISGTILNIYTEYQVQEDVSETYNVAILLISIGVLLVWLGIIRYFAYFPSFYLIFLILRKAIVKVVRYMFCVLILYTGFAICGWLVLGPYHARFRTFQSASECLFSVMNGDEVYETFADFTLTSGYLWWFSRIYLYFYIAVFTIIALNLVIAVILDCYDTIKDYVKNGFPKTEVFDFLEKTKPKDTTSDHQLPYFCLKSPSDRKKKKDNEFNFTESLPL